VLYESLHSTAQTSEGPTQLKGQQRFNKCGILLPIVCKSEKGLRDPMPQVKRVPSTLAHIAVDLDLNDSAHLATNEAVGARACRDFVAFLQHGPQLGAAELGCRGDLSLTSRGDTTLTALAHCPTTTHSLSSTVITREPLFSVCRSYQCSLLRYWPLPEPKATDAYKQLKTGKDVLSRGGLNCLSWNGYHGRLQVGDRHNLHREREDEQGQV